MFKLILISALLIACSLTQASVIHSEKSPLLVGSKNSSKSLSPDSNFYNLTLNKSALGHLFLMQTAMIDGAPSPTGNPLASKVVYFRRSGPFIGMFESTAGKVVTNSVTTEILLAKFPIINEDYKDITFNFEEGMKTLFYKGSYYIARPGSDPTKESTYKILESFLNKVELKNQYVFIEQFLRIESPASKTEEASVAPLHIKYTFSTYLSNKSFIPTVSPGFTNVGYFENHPVYPLDQNGEIIETPVTYIKKFDINKPVTYYLSSNTPMKWKQAVTDGVLYWNKAFGKEVIKVADLPANVTIFEPGYNIVQWLDWDTAGFAYAASNSDPLTGEIKNAHVFMTSSFSINSYFTAKTYLSRYDKEDISTHSFGLKGFTSSLSCADNTNRAKADKERLQDFITKVEEKSYTDEQKEEMYTRYVADYIRQVVAHEIGHTLGLRHNFAGSLDTNINSKNYESITLKYLTTGEVDTDVIPGNSVMDYTPGFFSSMAGAKIRLESESLLYDKHVIDVSYYGANPFSELSFCTDDHAEKFYDCFRFDAFNNVLEEKKYNIERSFKNIAHLLINGNFLFINDETLSEDEKIAKLRSVYINGLSDGIYMADNRFKELVTRSYKGAKSITGNLTALNDDFNVIGGMSNLLFKDITPTKKGEHYLSNYAEELIQNVKDIAPNYFEENLTNSISAELNTAVTNYAKEMDQSFLLNAIPYLTHEFEYRDEKFVESVSELSKVILRTRSATIESVEGIKAPLYNIKLGQKNLRKATGEFVKFDFFPDSHSFKRSMKNLRGELSKDMSKLSSEISTIYGDVDSSPDNVYDFYMEELTEVYNF